MLRTTKRAWLALAAGAVALPLALTGCTTDQATPAPSEGGSAGNTDGGRTYALITANVAGDAFWDVVKTGAETAAAVYGDTVNYQSDPDVVKQAQFVEGAVASGVDGIIIQLANADGLRDALAGATAAGIPIVTINSGADDSTSVGAIAHVGQTEYIAGQAVGERLNDEGAKNAICVIHEVGNIGLEDRCNGIKNTFGGSVTNVQVDFANIADAGNTIQSSLIADSSIDAVVTLNAAVAIAARDARDAAGSAAVVGTFDLSMDVLEAVKAGNLLFAIDQQQYVQGYAPVVLLDLYLTNGNTVGGGMPVLTGPAFITADNADAVITYAKNGTR